MHIRIGIQAHRNPVFQLDCLLKIRTVPSHAHLLGRLHHICTALFVRLKFVINFHMFGTSFRGMRSNALHAMWVAIVRMLGTKQASSCAVFVFIYEEISLSDMCI